MLVLMFVLVMAVTLLAMLMVVVVAVLVMAEQMVVALAHPLLQVYTIPRAGQLAYVGHI